MIWSGPVAHEQGASVMSSLPACFASGRSAQRNRLFGEGVACRWFAAVVAVGAEAVFEEFDACAQGGVLFLQNDNLPLQGRDQRENGVGSLVIVEIGRRRVCAYWVSRITNTKICTNAKSFLPENGVK